MPVYSVFLKIGGPIRVIRSISFDTEKEIDVGNVFTSDIEINPNPDGVNINCTVNTRDDVRAFDVALIFVGRMVDVLSLRLNRPLIVVEQHSRKDSERYPVKIVLSHDTFKHCFEVSKLLSTQHSTVLRALNWYRKGLYSNDPLDQYLAFWNAVSVIAGKFANSNERTRRGIVNKIYDCFEQVWGADISNWPREIGMASWINESNSLRDSIAHGTRSIEVNYIREITSKLEEVRQLAYKFVSTWLVNKVEGYTHFNNNTSSL